MNSLVALVLLVGAAVAAPQAAYKPFAAPYKAAAYPYSAPKYTAPFNAAAYPYSAPSYAVPAYPFATQYAKPSAFASHIAQPFVASVIKQYATPQYYNPQYPTQYVKPVAILRQSQDDNFDGSFTYDFEAENGIASQASGFVKNAGTEAAAQVIQGSYSYTAPDGTPIVTQYFADETGFHVQGDHLPVAPPVPEAIAKSLAYQASLPAPAPAPLAPAVYKSR